MLPTCYKLDLLFNRASNNTFAAKPLATKRGQENIHSPWKDFFWMHRFLTLHHLHSLCSRDFIMTFTSQHHIMPSIHLLLHHDIILLLLLPSPLLYTYLPTYMTAAFTWVVTLTQHFCCSFDFTTFNFQLKILNSVNFNSICSSCVQYLMFVFDE